MRAILISAAMALLAGCGSTPWSTTDKALLAGSTAALVVDWGQTRYIAQHPEVMGESNRALGEHPSTGRVNAYFASMIAANALVASVLPEGWRSMWLGSVMAFQIVVISNNASAGVGIAW